MGVRHQSKYRTTEHYIKRVSERFKVHRSDALSFFRRNSVFATYAGISNNHEGKLYEQWSTDEMTFVLDPQEFKIITVLPIEYTNPLVAEYNSELDNEIANELAKSINQQLYNKYNKYLAEFKNDIESVLENMSILERTKRPDYIENKIQDINSILDVLVSDYKNMKQEHDKLIKLRDNLKGGTIIEEW